MRTLAHLTVADWVKISPDMKWSLEQAARYPTWKVRDLEQGIPFLTGLFTGGIRADVVISHADGFKYFMIDDKIPVQWTCQMWTDFVIGIVQSPYVLEVGTLREWPVIGIAWFPEGIGVSSPAELAMIAGRAPAATVTPQPVIQPRLPIPAPRYEVPAYTPPLPAYTPPLPGYAPPDYGPPQFGFFQRLAGSIGVSPMVLGIGAAAVGGLIVVGVALKGRAPRKARKR